MPATHSRRKPARAQPEFEFSRWSEEETAYIRKLVEEHPDGGVDDVAKTFLKRFETRTLEAVKQRIFKLRRTTQVAPHHSQVVPSSERGLPLQKAVQQTLNAGGDFLLRLPTGAIVQGTRAQLLDALQRYDG